MHLKAWFIRFWFHLSLSSVLVVSLYVSPVIVACHFFLFLGFVWNLSYTIVFDNYICILMFYFQLPLFVCLDWYLKLRISYLVKPSVIVLHT